AGLHQAVAVPLTIKQLARRSPDQVPAAGGNHRISGGLPLGDADAARRDAFTWCVKTWRGENFFHQPHERETRRETQGEYLILALAMTTNHFADFQAA